MGGGLKWGWAGRRVSKGSPRPPLFVGLWLCFGPHPAVMSLPGVVSGSALRNGSWQALVVQNGVSGARAPAPWLQPTPPLILTHPQPYPEGSRLSGWKRNPSSPAPGAPSCSSWPVWDTGEGQPQGVRRPRACPPDAHCPRPGSLTSALCSLCTNSSGGVPVTFMISFSWSRSAAGQGHSMARPGGPPTARLRHSVLPCPACSATLSPAKHLPRPPVSSLPRPFPASPRPAAICPIPAQHSPPQASKPRPSRQPVLSQH